MKALRTLLILLPAAALVALAGCSSGEPADLRKRVDELESENKKLKDEIKKLNDELRPLRAKVDQLDTDQRQLEKTLSQAEKDLRSRLTDMVQQEVHGRRQRVIAQPPQPVVRFENRPYMGFDGQDLTPEVAKQLKLGAENGVIVTDVREGSPAAAAGLKRNDVMLQFDGAEIKSFQDLKRALEAKKPGETVVAVILRGDQKVEVKITLGVTKLRVDG